MSKIIVGTSNPNKIKEIAQILSPLGHEIIKTSFAVDETGKTIEENVKIKAIAYSEKNPNMLVIAEDSGLVVPYLNGLPGPYSARFHQIELDNSLTVINIPKEDYTTDKSEHDRLNNLRLINLIKKTPFEKRAAYFEVCFAIAENGVIKETFSGKSYGYISDVLRGTNGFGYDPLFIGNDSFGKTYAELDTARKNLRSHRKKALSELGLWISKNLN